MTLHPNFAIDPIPDPRRGRTFGPCKKCSSSDMRVDYHRSSRLDCKYTETCSWISTFKEHLVVHCVRCRIGWIEPTSDNANIPDGEAWTLSGQ